MASVCVLGATGSVGSALVRHLISDAQCGKVVVLTRRNVDTWAEHAKVKQIVVGMTEDKLRQDAKNALVQEGVVACFVTMGCGQPSKVSPEELTRVDMALPTEFAIAAKEAGVKHMTLMTSVGADINKKPSRLTGTAAGGGLYLHLKGQVEANFEQQAFPSLHIFQPSTLIGSPNTPGFFGAIAPKFRFMLPTKFWDVNVGQLGPAMAVAAWPGLNFPAGKKVFVGKELVDLCESIPLP